MKVFSIICFAIVLLALLIGIIIFENNVNRKKTELINIANKMIEEDCEYIQKEVCEKEEKEGSSDIQDYTLKKVFNKENIEKNNNVIGKIIIPKYGIEAPIQDGTSQEVLKYAVGHFPFTSYWKGNVGLASHNRGAYAHYFDKLNKLNVKDEIIYKTELGEKIYEVYFIKEIEETNVSVLKNTNQNELTLITCITNKPNLRLCVKANEKKV